MWWSCAHASSIALWSWTWEGASAEAQSANSIPLQTSDSTAARRMWRLTKSMYPCHFDSFLCKRFSPWHNLCSMLLPLVLQLVLFTRQAKRNWKRFQLYILCDKYFMKIIKGGGREGSLCLESLHHISGWRRRKRRKGESWRESEEVIMKKQEEVRRRRKMMSGVEDESGTN